MWILYKQALTLLAPFERRRFYWILILSCVAAVIQTVAILSIMPFIVLLANPDLLYSNQILANVYSAIGAQSYESFLTFFGLFGIAVLFVGNLIVALEHWASSRFLTFLEHRVQMQTLESILQQPLEYFSRRNPSRLCDVILSQVERVTDGIIGQSIVIFSNVALAIFIVVMLLIVSLKTTIAALFVLLLLYLSIFLLLRRRILQHGERLTELSGDVFTAVTEMLDGVREIKARGAEKFFARRFEGPSESMARLGVHYNIISVLPHFLLETILFGGLVFVALFFLLKTQDPGLTLSLIALYGLATYRLVPSLKSAFEAISEMQHNADALNVVRENIRLEKAPSSCQPIATLRRDVTLSGVGYSYNGLDSPNLCDIDLTIPVGSSLCLFGQSGAGKSTLLNIIAGLVLPMTGRVSCDSKVLSSDTLIAWRERIGFCPQSIFLFDDTVASNIAFGVSHGELDQARVEKVARLACLDAATEARLLQGYATKISQRGRDLSGGQAQRIGIARALYRDPDVIILDESFSGLDASNRDRILDNLFLLPNKTLIFASHDPVIAARCDRVAVLENGRIVSVGPFVDNS